MKPSYPQNPFPTMDDRSEGEGLNFWFQNKRKFNNLISAYAVQCSKCFKFRIIPTREEYETIRQNFIKDPWVCHNNPNLSCNDPGDVEYNTSRFWVIDKPNLPKTPAGLDRLAIMRSDFSKMDINYVMPNGKRLRSSVEIEKFIEANQEYKGRFTPADFSFTPPKIPEEMIPKGIEGSSSKKKKTGL
ncbi:hypothetical protein ZIOFF_001131 [Zingiber officinale]|uniref:Uncharacterized protein n=1 Tax=Zingiber officinale TaxID=94328 RepID=A0A8J5M8B9_ZINOF|nr:hypothetical protein ZIOFF_001131 [Zingiber officinale]